MIVVKTPLRISFLGGGTDFRDFYQTHGGAVLSTAINKYVYVMLNQKYDGLLRVSYSETENVAHTSELKHDIIRTALEMFNIDHGVEIVIVSDVTGKGTGLGSSSSLAVGLVRALAAYTGVCMPTTTVAQKACELEIDKLRKSIGEQDQFIAAFGGVQLIEWSSQGYTRKSSIPVTDLQDWLLLLDTEIKRGDDDILKVQQSGISTNVQTLHRMKNLAFDGHRALHQKDYVQFGQLLNTNWTLKKTLSSNISNPVVDAMYQRGLDSGALGGKLCGAGGGGFLLLCVPPEKRATVKEAVGLREMPIEIGVLGVAVTTC